MATFKITVADTKSGKTTTHELKDSQAQPLIGLRIGDTFDGTIVGLTGKIRITGGSDKSGIPMRADVHGAVKKYVLTTEGTGLRKVESGQRRRKLIRGNMITDEIYQINAILVSEENVATNSI